MKRDREEGAPDDDAAPPSKAAATDAATDTAPATAAAGAVKSDEEEAAPALALVNLDTLLEVVDSDIDFAVDLVNEALGEFAGHVAAMRAAAGGGGGETWLAKMRAAAHSVKGVAGNLSFERLQAAAADLETWARARADAPAAASAAASAATATAKVDALEAILDEVKGWSGGARAALEAHAPA